MVGLEGSGGAGSGPWGLGGDAVGAVDVGVAVGDACGILAWCVGSVEGGWMYWGKASS